MHSPSINYPKRDSPVIHSFLDFGLTQDNLPLRHPLVSRTRAYTSDPI